MVLGTGVICGCGRSTKGQSAVFSRGCASLSNEMDDSVKGDGRHEELLLSEVKVCGVTVSALGRKLETKRPDSRGWVFQASVEDLSEGL